MSLMHGSDHYETVICEFVMVHINEYYIQEWNFHVSVCAFMVACAVEIVLRT